MPLNAISLCVIYILVAAELLNGSLCFIFCLLSRPPTLSLSPLLLRHILFLEIYTQTYTHYMFSYFRVVKTHIIIRIHVQYVQYTVDSTSTHSICIHNMCVSVIPLHRLAYTSVL